MYITPEKKGVGPRHRPMNWDRAALKRRFRVSKVCSTIHRRRAATWLQPAPVPGQGMPPGKLGT